jgi:hypothetical protein
MTSDKSERMDIMRKEDFGRSKHEMEGYDEAR